MPFQITVATAPGLVFLDQTEWTLNVPLSSARFKGEKRLTCGVG